MKSPGPSTEGKPTPCEHESLKYQLLGPSLTKSGQDEVDQQKVSEIIYNASKGSKFFNNEENRDKNLTQKIQRILDKREALQRLDLTRESRRADEYIQELELSRDLSQTIVHIDCDAFYAAVEELDHPELRDLPFSVGVGVLTTCNYHARKFGCRSGMAGFVAKKLCPSLIQLPLNFDKYTSKAQEVRQILVTYDDRFESASIDEAYLNITVYMEEHDITAEDAVQQLRREIHEKTNITVSAGIAANAKLAKICSNKNKPNGQFTLPPDRNSILAFTRSLPTRKVNGIGRVLERQLEAIDIRVCGDIYEHRRLLSSLFGDKAFRFLIQCYLGLGRTKIQPAEDYERKSVGTESTFADMGGHDELRQKLRRTAEELEKDMDRTGFRGRTLVLKVKLHTYEVITRQVVPPKPVFHADDLYKHSVPMLAKLEHELPGMRLRLMGLRCTHLVGMQKPDVISFFGLRKGVAATDCTPSHTDGTILQKRKARRIVGEEEEQWEAWPDTEAEDNIPDGLSQGPDRKVLEPTPLRQMGEILLETSAKGSKNGSEVEDLEWWDCPVCQRPQVKNEKTLNSHIDLCLSRQAIKDVVQDSSQFEVISQRPAAYSKRSKPFRTGVKVEKVQLHNDPRQLQLYFGS